MATLLATVQEICRRLAQPVPATVYGSTDKSVLQMMALLQEGLDSMTDRGPWEVLTYEYTWTTIADENQGPILGAGLGSAPVALNGFNYLLPETLWDRTNKLPLVGTLSAADWQAMKAVVITGPRFQFRLRGGNFLVNPAPEAGYTWAFEYISNNPISTGSTYVKKFTADNNTILLPDNIVEADLKWRWKKEKGLSYEEDFRTCETMIHDALGRNQGPKALRMDNMQWEPRPMYYINPYNTVP